MNAGLLGVGKYVPSHILTNEDLEKRMDTSDEWIRTMTGIEERRIADDDMDTSHMAYHAAVNAIERFRGEPRRNRLNTCRDSHTGSSISISLNNATRTAWVQKMPQQWMFQQHAQALCME